MKYANDNDTAKTNRESGRVDQILLDMMMISIWNINSTLWQYFLYPLFLYNSEEMTNIVYHYICEYT